MKYGKNDRFLFLNPSKWYAAFSRQYLKNRMEHFMKINLKLRVPFFEICNKFIAKSEFDIHLSGCHKTYFLGCYHLSF